MDFNEINKVNLNFSVVAKYCFDKNGDIKKENYDFTKIRLLRNLIVYDEEFFNLCEKYPKLKDFLCDLTCYARNTILISPIGNIFEKYTQEDGSIDDELKNNIRKFIRTTGDLTDFEGLYEACFKKKQRYARKNI